MQQLILREYRTTIRCNTDYNLPLDGLRVDNGRKGLQGKSKKEKGRQVLQEKIFARTKKKAAIPKSTLPSIPVPRHKVQADGGADSTTRPRDGPFLPHLPRQARPAGRQSPNEFELHSIVEILNLKKKELHSSEQKPDMVMTRAHRSPAGKNMKIPKDLPMTIKSYRDGQSADGATVLRPPRQIVVVLPSVALESPRKAVKQTQLVMVDNKAEEEPHTQTVEGDSLGRLTGRYLTRRPSQEHRAGHFNNFRQYLKRSKSRKAAPFGIPPSASTQDKRILNVSGRNTIPTLPVIPSIRREDEIQTVMGENGVVLNGDFPANLSEDTSSSVQSELGKSFSNSSSSKSSLEAGWSHNGNVIRVKRLSQPQQKVRKVRDRQGRDSGNESSDSVDGLKDRGTTDGRSRPRWSPGRRRYVVDKSHIHQHVVSKNGHSVPKRYFEKQDRENTKSSLPSGHRASQDYLTRTVNGNPKSDQNGSHIVYVEKTHAVRRRRESLEKPTDAHFRHRDCQRPLGQITPQRNPPPSPVDTGFSLNFKKQVGNSRPDSGRATENSDSTALSHHTDGSGVHSEVRKQPAKAPAIWDETFTMRVTEDRDSASSESDTESMPKPITMISINQSEHASNAQTSSETAELEKNVHGRTQDIDNRSLLSVPDTESLRACTPMPNRGLNDADDTESTSTISVPKITMTCATPLPPRATPSITPPPADGVTLFVSDISRLVGHFGR